MPVRALLDTGATVSLMSASLASTVGLTPNPITDFRDFKVECANGELLPYTGYAITDVRLNNSETPGIFLVVPDSTCMKSVPVVLGTNVLEKLQYPAS